ncbi:CLUMA_CG008915, isoform A [Clunio marinus]|uniref:CLUMA_CG008915, isoform A n=1 Tax=Clunio marinus TaxID=568069 RepID=A0A1J1I906_9DIPT|nr:CLUMA_CG008915, isoform A [Clunio marinus]
MPPAKLRGFSVSQLCVIDVSATIKMFSSFVFKNKTQERNEFKVTHVRDRKLADSTEFLVIYFLTSTCLCAEINSEATTKQKNNNKIHSMSRWKIHK